MSCEHAYIAMDYSITNVCPECAKIQILVARGPSHALYKYVTAERIDVLQNELIRFTQPSALNDPWDVRRVT
jgi:hypothetical protein